MRMKKLVGILTIIVVCLTNLLPAVNTAVAQGENQDASSIELPAKGNANLDSHLNTIAAANASQKSAARSALPNRMETAENRERVIVECSQEQIEATLSAIGPLAEIEATHGNLIQASVPVSSLVALSELPGVRFVRQPYPFFADTITSEGVPVINADDWQGAGYTGTGVKIAILDGGFAGYTARQASGELPASLTTHWSPSLGGPGSSEHGTACAEIIYDLAPGAQLYLVNFDTEVEFGNAVDWLIAQDVDIISHSMGWPISGPGDGTGPICQIVDRAHAAGILWVNSIGNSAQRHWRGNFINTDGDPYNEFALGDELNTISVQSGDVITVLLKWNDTWGASANDYDLLLVDNSFRFVAYSADIQDGNDDPVEGLSYVATYTGNYYIAIGKLGNPAQRNFHLYSIYHDLEHKTASGSLSVPSDSDNALAAGAIPWDNPTTLETFSSQGPTQDGRIKPDLVAPDGVSTETYGISEFYGTSASAPHVAGAAAMVKGRYSEYTTTQIRSLLTRRAVDLGNSGKDNLYGWGRLDLLGRPPTLTSVKLDPPQGVSDSTFLYSVLYTDVENEAPAAITISIDGGPHQNMIHRSGQDNNYYNGEYYDYIKEGLTQGSHSYQLEANDGDNNATGDAGIKSGPFIIEGTWQIQTVDGSDAGYGTSLQLDSSGNPHIAYRGSGLSYARWNGSSWDIQSVDPHGHQPSLVLDSLGNPHIAYVGAIHDIGDGGLMYARWDGTTWQVQTIDTERTLYPTLILDSSGIPCISYRTGYLGDSKIKLARWDGGSWQIQVVDTEVGKFSCLALDNADNPNIAYVGDIDTYNHQQLKYAILTASGWQTGSVHSECQSSG